MCLLLLAAVPPVWGATPAPSITASFATFWSAAQGRPFAQQVKQWDRYIEAPRADLYASVVWEAQQHPDWVLRKPHYLEARFAEYPAIASGIPGEAASLQQVLDETIPRFHRLFPLASMHPPVEVVLAPNFDAKSGVLGDGTPVLALAVDSLLLEKANLDIVVPHELFHLYHAQHVGFRNDGVMPDVPLTIPLFEEGLATYVSGELSPGHTDGELLLEDELGAIPANRLPDIARRFLVDARSKAMDHEHPENFKRWFNAAPTPYQQGLPNRSGYWLGLQVIRYLRHTYTLTQIAAWSPTEADKQVMLALQKIGAKP